MLSFRILGPLEVRDEQAAIALGGPRQRALLVALLLRAGRVVPTEQLVDELYGDEPPKTATDVAPERRSSRCGRHSARTSSSRGPPGTCSRSSASRSTRIASRGCSRTRDGRRPDERRALLVRALELWRGPAAGRVRVRGLGADRDPATRGAPPHRARGADRHRYRARPPGRRRAPSSSSLVVEHPLRERALVPADVGSARGRPLGGGAPGLQGRARRAGRARHRAGRGAPPPPGRDPARRGTGPRRANGHGADRDADEVVKALLSGRVVPVLGLDGGADLAAPARARPSATRPTGRPTWRVSRSTSRR